MRGMRCLEVRLNPCLLLSHLRAQLLLQTYRGKIKQAIRQHSGGLALGCLPYAAGFQNSFEVCVLENHFPSHITLSFRCFLTVLWLRNS